MVLRLDIRGFGGTLCQVEDAAADWTVRVAKSAVEAKLGLPAREQRLACGVSELHDDQLLSDCAASDTLELSLVKRPPEQALWLESVRLQGDMLAHAPEHIRADRELALASVRRSSVGLFCADERLWTDREVVLTA